MGLKHLGKVLDIQERFWERNGVGDLNDPGLTESWIRG